MRNEYSDNEDGNIEHENQKYLSAYYRDESKSPVLNSRSIVQLFEMQVKRTPDKVALILGKKELSYRELNEKSNKLAHYIKSHYAHLMGESFKPETFVALLFDRSIEMIVAILAVLKAGGTYIPLDPDYPPERIRFILNDSGCGLALTKSYLKEKLHADSKKIATIAVDELDVMKLPAENLNSYFQAENLAYVIYTSGTTGHPKGVMIEHRSVVNLINDQIWRLNLNTNACVLQYASYVFDASVWEIFIALSSGARLLLVDPKQRYDINKLLNLFSQKKITHALLPPALIHSIPENKFSELSNLTHLVVGGEVLQQKTLLKLLEQNIEVINAYGPSESTVCATMNFYRKNSKNNNIGKPLSNIKIYILNSELNLCQPGEIGEIYISGVGLFREYLNQPNLNKKNILKNKFANHQEKLNGYNRFYKTGDLGRYLTNESIEFLGRNDTQIKLHGYRIELSEIENTLLSHADVQQSLVVLRDYKYLIAYYVSSKCNEKEIENFLSKKLPDYMMPSAIVRLKKFPVTLHGKINLKELPNPSLIRQNMYVSPKTKLEMKLCAVWEKLFKINKIGITDNFFHMGGNSILAMKCAHQINEALNWRINATDIFTNKTISSLVKNVIKQQFDKIEISRKKQPELSFAQERLFFIEEYVQGTHAYHVPILLELKNNINHESLKKALMALIKRHEVLRTLIGVDSNGRNYQKISESYPEVKKKKFYKNNDFQTALKKDINTIFNLKEEIPIRIYFYDVESTSRKSYLLVNIHHIAFDGWSLDIFLKELIEHYQYYQEGIIPVLSHLSVQYKDYSLWQRTYLNDQKIKRELNFWKRKLFNSQVLQLPLDGTRPLDFDYQGETIDFELSNELSNQLRNLAKNNACSLYTVLLSGFYILLYSYTSQNDIIIGTPFANRHSPQVKNLLGLFINNLPIRIQFDPETDHLNSLLEKVHSNLMEVHQHQDIPFEKIVNHLQINPDRSRHPLFQVMFSVQNFGKTISSEANNIFDSIDLEQLYNPARFDISLFIDDSKENLKGYFNYAISLFNRDTIERMILHYQKALSFLISNEKQLIRETCLLTDNEYQKIIYDWNGTQSSQIIDKTVIEYFSRQVEKNPDEVAVVFEKEKFSYRELNRQVNQLSYHLRKHYFAISKSSFKKENLVGLYFDRSVEMMIGILAVLKAGGAYVPIAINCPTERLRFILEDTQCQLILTRSGFKKKLHAVIEDIKLIAVDQLKEDESLPEKVKDYSRLENLAYVIYTSGTTGQPKGVMITHSSFSNFLQGFVNKFNNKINTLSLTYYTFDIFGLEYGLPLISGGTLFFSDIQRFKHDIAKYRETINLIQQTPSVLLTLINQLPEESAYSGITCLVGGEIVPKNLIAKLNNKFGHVINVFGPTETTIWSMAYHCADGSNYIGKPLVNEKAYVLNQYRQPMPIGAIGELYIGGAGVARGYLNNLKLTKKCFVKNPFLDNECLYKTGDLVRFLPDGNIDYIERNDFQVKIRGYRIELSEIERALLTLDDIDRCVVNVNKKENNDDLEKYLVAYYVSENKLEDEVIVKALADKLPDHMIPNYFLRIDKLPLTINGKIDRKALPNINFSICAIKFIPPKNDLEKKLCKTWEKLLNARPIGMADNFFQKGGHSLLAIRCAIQMSELLNKQITVADIFSYKTISNIIKYTKNQQKENIPINSSDKNPLSYAQERLWFIEQYNENSNAYHIPILLELKNSVDTKSLELSLKSIVARHQILRTLYYQDKTGKTYQLISNNNLKLTYNKFFDKKDYFSKLNEDINRSFNLRVECPIRYSLYYIESENKIYLLINIHHIAFDGWSIDILLSELMEYYNHYSEGKALSLPPLSIQYKDYANWQRHYLTKDLLNLQLTYWKKQLHDYEKLHLPFDKSRPNSFDYSGETISFELSPILSKHLNYLAKAYNCSLYTVLLSGFYLLIYSYTGQSDIIIGTPVANRHHDQLQNLIGLFVNNLVLRVQFNAEKDTVGTLLEYVQSTLTDAQRYQEIPFEKLVNYFKVEQDRSQHPLFQIMFGLQNSNFRTNDIFKMIEVDHYYGPAKFDLSLFMETGGETLKGYLNYATSLFNRSSIERMVVYYQNALHTLVSDNYKLIREVSLLGSEEYEKIIYQWNQTNTYYPKKSIIQLFEEQANNNPNKIALIFENQEISYQELNTKVNQMARFIRKYYKKVTGVTFKSETFVALYFERGIDLIISLLAVLKSGGAYVPLEPDYPKTRIQYILKEIDSHLILTQFSIKNKLVEITDSNLLCVDQLNLERENRNNLNLTVYPNQLAYVIYTSGTTGKPKGVMIEHHSVVNLVVDQQKSLSINSDSIILQFASIVFDASVWEIFPALCLGASLNIVPNIARKDPAILLEHLETHQISVATLPPVFLSQLPYRHLPQLKILIIAGELCDKTIVMKWCENRDFVNAYGPTESTVCASLHHYRLGDPVSNIGKPIGNTHTYILNKYDKPVGIGVIGELHISGAGLARGYLKNNELTKSRFIHNPFYKDDQEKIHYYIYKTGDLARYHEDGSIEFIGRCDSQIKLRGHRIELGEIETVISKLHGIHQCVVIMNGNDQYRNRQLIAYYMADKPINEKILREQLILQLPDYMIPNIFVYLKKIPFTINGKLDKNSLPAPKALLLNDSFEAPRNEIENTLCYIWKELFGLEEISIHDDFFRLGGNSILAIEFVGRASKELGIKIPVADIFIYKTIAKLSMQLSHKTVSFIRESVTNIAPLSYAQESLWFIEKFIKGKSAYHIPMVFSLKENVNFNDIDKAINALVKRHKVLRSIIIQEEDNLYQKVLNDKVPINIVKFKSIDDYKIKLDDDINRPFDLSKKLPIRVCFYINESNNHEMERFVLINIHHIAFDGWSIRIFFHELDAFYQHFKYGEALKLSEMDIQYKDYVVWLRTQPDKKKITEDINFWKAKLKHFEPLNFPLDKMRPLHRDYEGRNINFSISKEYSKKIRNLAQKKGYSLFTLLLTGFYILLHKYSGQNDICIGIPSANRDHPQTQNLIGFFINSLILRIDFITKNSINHLLKEIHEALIEAQCHQDLSFDQLIKYLAIERDTSQHPIFQIMFSVQSFDSKIGSSNSNWRNDLDHTIENKTAKFDLSLFIDDAHDELQGYFNYATSLFEEETIIRLISHYKIILENMIVNIDKKIDDINLLTDKEEKQILYEWNKTEITYDEKDTLSSKFEKQVSKTPNNIAIDFQGETLTYNELNQKSNQLARYIRLYYQQNIGGILAPETLIGIYFDRSIEMIISILAILKAGAAYVPLSPEFPLKRIDDITKDCKLKIILTDSKQIDRISKLENKIYYMTLNSEVYSKERKKNLPKYSKSDNLACVLYTSGTTGIPKGVLLVQKAIINHIEWIQSIIPLNESDAIIQKASYVFDASIREILWANWYGAKTVIAKPDGHKDSEYLYKLLEHHRVKVLHFVPSMLEAFLMYVESYNKKLPNTLLYMICGGEILKQNLVKHCRALAENKNFTLYNVYGPTETTINAIYSKRTIQKSGVIGRPTNNTKIYILDANLKPVPIGVIGEIYIGGAGVSRGYLNRPDLTKERYIANPFANIEDKKKGYTKLYKTGDLARYLIDGEIEYVSRRDLMVKVRGYRIELNEIEKVLGEIQGIKQCAVVAQNKNNDDINYQTLVAYYVSSVKIDHNKIFKNLSNKLPNYMIPSIFIKLPELPVTINGKLNRKLLPKPDLNIVKKRYVPPRNAIEKKLCSIFEELLGVDKIGIEDDFFQLGGNSLLTIQLSARIIKHFSFSISLQQIFELRVVKNIARIINISNDNKSIYTIPINSSYKKPKISFEQKLIFDYLKYYPTSTLFQSGISLLINQDVKLEVFVSALKNIINDFPLLRTKYKLKNNFISPIVYDSKIIDINSVFNYKEYLINNESQQRKYAEEQRLKMANAFMNFENNFLYKFQLTKISETKNILIISMSRIITDGYSLSMILRSLFKYYIDIKKCKNITNQFHYFDYSAWQAIAFKNSIIEKNIEYWKSQELSVSRRNILISDKKRPKLLNGLCGCEKNVLSCQLTNKIREYYKKHQVSSYSVFFGAWATCLSKISKKKDICIAAVHRNRNKLEFENIQGPFSDYLPIRVKNISKNIFSDTNHIKYINKLIRECLDHSVPYSLLLEKLNVNIEMRHRYSNFPFTQTAVNFPSPYTEKIPENYLEYEFVENTKHTTSFEISVVISESKNNYAISLNYREELFNKKTIKNILNQYLHTINELVGEES